MPTGAADADAPDRATCLVRGWRVFGPGYHKGQLYSPADCQTIAANFARRVLTPTVKLGHDRQQRLADSWGVPGLGKIARCECEPDGTIVLDLADVPRKIGGKINAGQLNSGSVQLKAGVPDPADPAKKLPGDVLTAVALLGEEQPAVPGFAPPRATYADGAEVEPDHDADEWLAAVADVARQMAAESRQPDPAERVICFSDMFQEPPVTIDDVLAFLATATPEDKAKCAATCGAPPAGADPNNMAVGGGNVGAMEHHCPRVKDEDGDTKGYERPKDRPHSADTSDSKEAAVPADPTAGITDPGMKAFAKFMSDQMADVTKRGGLEADKTAQMSAAAEEKERAFSAQVDREVKARGIDLRVTPHVLKTSVRPTALGILQSKEFSSDAEKTREFSAYLDGFGALPVNPALRSTVNDSKGKPGTPSSAYADLLALVPEGAAIAKKYATAGV